MYWECITNNPSDERHEMVAKSPHKASLHVPGKAFLYQMGLNQNLLHVLEDPFPV